MQLCPQCGTPNDNGVRYCAHCGGALGEARPDPLIGRTVGGAYLLQELVGVGGMGRVYRAEQNMLGRTVAVKVIHPHLLGDDQTVARFYNEARAASRLNHPDSVSIIDFGRTEDGILYLVMEYLAGKDLAHILAEEGPLPFLRICRVVRHVLSALGEAHALGVVHRDLKPENIIARKVRRGAEQIKVVDFGLAHIVGPGGSSITTPGLVCGTPDYMSPEQGKGETVDGRGDLYSVGVVLFEMLTDRLPYEDDTPTKVVFKHIHDPIPDPRQVAPHRMIPEDLAKACLKSLQKRADSRFQSADEMFEAIGKVEERLEATRGDSVTACPSCGSRNPAEQKFCGTCGSRLTDRFTVPPSFRSSPPPPPKVTLDPLPDANAMIGRKPELQRLLELRDRSDHAATWVRLVGEAGIGKTRLMNELRERLDKKGDVCVFASPHPSGAPVPYWPVRQLVRGLLDVSEKQLEEIVKTTAVGDPIARAGFTEVLRPTGLPGRPGTSRAEAVAVAMAAAVRVAAGRSDSGRVALFVDDLWRCDSLSAQVLVRLTERMVEGPLFMVTASTSNRTSVKSDESVQIFLRGLDHREATAMLSGNGLPETAATGKTLPPDKLMRPLFLEQLIALGVDEIGTDEAPTRLADAVLQRLERLDVSARRLFQSIVALGDSTPLEWVQELARGTDLQALTGLANEGLVTVEKARVTVCHPFVRELVEASIPAEYRKELHASALQVAAGHDAPLEVRAEHAWRAGEPFSALLLLERMGDSALHRGDADGAVLAYRRGLDVARRELLMTGETTLDRAIVTFSRKLGDAMDRSGDTMAADGVLREALELAGPASTERTKMLLVLARVARRRNRENDATRLLEQTLELSARQHDRVSEAQAQIALAQHHLSDKRSVQAQTSLTAALGALKSGTGNDELFVEASLLAAEAHTAQGEHDAAVAQLQEAKKIAEKLAVKALLAQVLAALGAAYDAGPHPELAAAMYREAGRLAAEAGDADGARIWVRQGRVSEARQVG